MALRNPNDTICKYILHSFPLQMPTFSIHLSIHIFFQCFYCYIVTLIYPNVPYVRVPTEALINDTLINCENWWSQFYYNYPNFPHMMYSAWYWLLSFPSFSVIILLFRCVVLILSSEVFVWKIKSHTRGSLLQYSTLNTGI